MAVPALAQTDFFPVAGAGSFDTYSNGATGSEGYTNGGSGASCRLGYSKQGLGWMSWDAKAASSTPGGGTETVSYGDLTGDTIAQFLAANPTATATLYVNVANYGSTVTGTYGITSIRCGNQGVMTANGTPNVGPGYTAPASDMQGSTQDWAWSAGAGSWSQNGILNADDVPWIAVGTTSSHYASQFTTGQNIAWRPGITFGPSYGWDTTMDGNGGQPWAVNCLIGGDWSQGGVSVSRAQTAGQAVNTDASNNAVYLNVAAATVASPRPASAAGNYIAVPINAALLASIANEGASTHDKAIAFDNWFAGATSSSGNPAFYGPNQNNGANSFLELSVVPEPATMVLLALGGLALIRRRNA